MTVIPLCVLLLIYPQVTILCIIITCWFHTRCYLHTASVSKAKKRFSDDILISINLVFACVVLHYCMCTIALPLFACNDVVFWFPRVTPYQRQLSMLYCSHRGLTLRTASMQSIYNLVSLGSVKLLQAAKLCPPVLVQRAFSVTASFPWAFLGYNFCFCTREVGLCN